MKKRTKEVLAGVLVLSTLVSTPAGQMAADRERMAVFQTSFPHCIRIREETPEILLEVLPEDTLEDKSDPLSEMLSEDTSKDKSENLSEVFSEDMQEDESENLSEVLSENKSEDKSESTLKAYPEGIPGEVTETENKTVNPDITKEEEWVEIPVSHFSPEISEDGELDYRTYIDQGADLTVKVRKQEAEQPDSRTIKVRNCALEDSDFYIELSRDGQVQQYTYPGWLDDLESRGGWVNDKAEVKLSDTGKKYFTVIRMEEQGKPGTHGSALNTGKRTYVLWAENSDRNASTKGVENGTRCYTLGIDADAPVLKEFYTDSACYEPTKTDTEQYFAQDFILKGTYCDVASGVGRIEYTTDFGAKKDAVWVEAETMRQPDPQQMDFQIVLPDGNYPAIAVRAYDEAGNVSEAKRFANDAGESVQVIVDRTAPVPRFHVTAGAQSYSGENDHWTNKDVQIGVMPDEGSCPYAGIYQYEYTYMKIGENMADVPEDWTVLPVQDGFLAELEITEDKNGYFLFRAVSKSGVAAKEDARQRILIQHQAAEIKPLVISGADETKCKDGWYNKQSGTPVIRFEYPDYDTGILSKEYDAPITIHYLLTRKESVPETQDFETSDKAGRAHPSDGDEKSARIGVMSSRDVTVCADGGKEFVLTEDDLDRHVIDFGYDADAGEAQDGFYILEYWITDEAGNASEKQTYSYKIDCHEPTDLTMELDGSALTVGKESVITYRRFYQDTVSGSADAQYGISGKGSLEIRRVKKIGGWNDTDSGSSGDADSISISPNARCFLYIRAEDAAGNVAEGWTGGIVVDNMAPNEAGGGNGRELIIEPKGANAHGFFNDDITVDIRIKDAPEDDNCASLKMVTGSVGRDGTDTIADKELFSFTKDSPTEDEIIAASGFECTQLVDAKANESNEAYIEVTATDRSDNTKTSIQLLKIDVTKPEVDISFDDNNAQNGNFYARERTATVHVHELNFDPAGVRVSVTRDGQPFEVSLSGWTGDGSDHYATLTFAEDGEYRIRAGCVDLADNASGEVQSEPFVIDRTAPEIRMELSAGQGAHAADQNYFNTDVTAVITVTEHNFRAEDFIANVTPVSEKGTWSHEGDIHTLRIPFADDGAYHIDCAYADLAGNPADIMERDFIIDTAAPAVVIEGVVDNSANSGAVLPVISVSDTNMEVSGISLSVTTGTGDVVQNAVQTEFASDEGGGRCRMTLTDMTNKPDNIYYLTVSACDLAGNEARLTYRFSLNRKGSVYDLTSLMQLMEKQYNTYDALGDIRIIEMNVDTVEEFELYVSRNGAIGYEAEYTKETSGSADTGYTYSYQIKKENFAAEGTYRLSLYSRDRAGNEVNNVADIHGNEISFVIDNTAPKVILDGIESGKVYDAKGQEVHISVTDNFRLAEAEFTLVNKADEVLESWDYMELAGEGVTLDITILQYHEPVALLYRVKDAAGNETQTFREEQTALSGFLATADQFVQLVSKPSETAGGKLGVITTGGAGAAALSAAVSIRRRRRKMQKDTCN